MDTSSNFNGTIARQVVHALLREGNLTPLSTIEADILVRCCDRQTYAQIAEHLGYTEGHVADIASGKLWQRLSQVLQLPVKKSNVAAILREQWEFDQHRFNAASPIPHPDDGPLPVGSAYYVERVNTHRFEPQALLEPGGIIQIKGAKSMGKTSMIFRVLDAVPDLSICYLDLDQVEASVLSQAETFLKWLCYFIGRSQQINASIETHWDSDLLTPVSNCSDYMEDYILPECSEGLILVLDGIDRLFAQSDWVEDVLKMLRNWHERGKISGCWQRLRLVLARSTEVYFTLDLNYSPFNVGQSIYLSPFQLLDLQTLIYQYDVEVSPSEIEFLATKLGGHPYLTQIALYTHKIHHTPLDLILRSAADEDGCYITHLRRLLSLLQQSPSLLNTYGNVVRSPHPIAIDTFHIYQLQGLGLITLQKNNAQPSCDLYREYFARVL